ncbi:MAG: alpha/beta hydrolase [Polyangiaceae bacterium]
MPADGRSLLFALEHQGARLLSALPAAAQRWLAGQRAGVRVDGLDLAPEMQLILALRKRLRPPLSTLSPGQARRQLRREALVHGGVPIAVAAVRDLEIDGPARRLAVRHYAPEGGQGAPLCVYFHGGGFVVCDLDTHDPVCRFLCRHAGVHVLAVDYRLAPEEPFPAAVEDALCAFRWAAAHAAELGADATRVAVAGDSAGGNLAAVVSQLARLEGEGGAQPALQLLLYPTVDRTEAWGSLDLFHEGFFLTRADIDWYQEQYTGTVGADLRDPRVSPRLRPDLGGLPPALVVTAGFDPLRDEGEAYARALGDAGVPVLLRRFDGLVHGFANMVAISPASGAAMFEIAASLRTALAMTRGASRQSMP